MDWNAHSRLEGNHAFLSPSKHHWVNYDEDKLIQSYMSALAAQRGSEMHELAHRLIRLGVKLPDIQRTLNMYVNDAIGFRMTPEQTLFYSINCYGTADAISFRNKTLRVADLKTGITETSMRQLLVYAALFCLEYKHKPLDIRIELRIYQNDAVEIYEATPDEVFHVMDRIKTFDRVIMAIREEAV